MDELASLKSLKVATTSELTSDQDACVLPGQILVNAHKHPVRQRYSIAHEIAHTLFPDYAEELARVGRLWRRAGDESEFERLCQIGAAELLMPLGPFTDACAARGRSIPTIVSLKEVFQASVDATAGRVVETSDVAMVALFLRPRDIAIGAWIDVRQGDAHTPYAHLAVKHAFGSAASGDLSVIRQAKAPKNSAADRAWKRVSLSLATATVHSTAEESWEHAGLRGRWAGEAIALPARNGAPHQVLCLLHGISRKRDVTS
jgi:hypothetical protein